MKLKRHGLVLEPEGDVGAIFNCAATEFEGNVYLLPRVVKAGYTLDGEGNSEDYISEIWLANSRDGRNFMLSNKPLIKCSEQYDWFGCEDPRVVKLNGEYLITYTALSEPACSGKCYRIALALTKDFYQLEKFGIVGPDVNDKDAVIFPETFNGRVGMLHRIEPDIQIAYFDDFEQLKKSRGNKFWENHMRELDKHVVLDRKYEWESEKVGAGPPPIKTKEGWLLIYHGVDESKTYRAGAALLDLDDPQKVIARSRYPVLEPEMEYERVGDVPNIVFPEGVVVRESQLLVYYGGADKVCCLATCCLDELVGFLLSEN